MTARAPAELTAHQLGVRFLGVREVPVTGANPAILAALQLDASWPQDDAVPWCSAWLNLVCGNAPRNPTIIRAPGHVGLFDGRDRDGRVRLLGGNQDNRVKVAPFAAVDVLGVRRL